MSESNEVTVGGETVDLSTLPRSVAERIRDGRLPLEAAVITTPVRDENGVSFNLTSEECLDEFTNLTLFTGFDRSKSIDSCGLPSDRSVITYLHRAYKGVNSNSVLITPSISKKSQVFDGMYGAFIDEEVIMRMKWPMSKDVRKDPLMRKAWEDTCVNVLAGAVTASLPVVMSIKMWEKIKLSVDSRYLFKLKHIPSGDEKSSLLESKAFETDADIRDVEREFNREVESFREHMFHDSVPSLSEIKTYARMNHPYIVSNYVVLRDSGFAGINEENKEYGSWNPIGDEPPSVGALFMSLVVETGGSITTSRARDTHNVDIEEDWAAHILSNYYLNIRGQGHFGGYYDPDDGVNNDEEDSAGYSVHS